MTFVANTLFTFSGGLKADRLSGNEQSFLFVLHPVIKGKHYELITNENKVLLFRRGPPLKAALLSPDSWRQIRFLGVAIQLQYPVSFQGSWNLSLLLTFIILLQKLLFLRNCLDMNFLEHLQIFVLFSIIIFRSVQKY